MTNSPSTGTGKGKLTPHRAFILDLHDQGASAPQIRAALLEKGVEATNQGVWLFVKKQVERRAIASQANPLVQAAKLLADAAAQYGGVRLNLLPRNPEPGPEQFPEPTDNAPRQHSSLIAEAPKTPAIEALERLTDTASKTPPGFTQGKKFLK